MAPKRTRPRQPRQDKNKRQRKSTPQARNVGQDHALPDLQKPAENSGSNALECSICHKTFKNPKMLPCGHSFCTEDLVRWAPLGIETISCPSCREQFPVPDGDVTQFPTNFHLKELADEKSLLQQLTSGKVESSCTCCDVGKQSTVVAKCQECSHYLCTTGLAEHKYFEGWQDHNVYVLEETAKIYLVLRSRIIKTKQDHKYERKADDWAIFDVLYDQEHSMDLLRYWIALDNLQQTRAQSSRGHYGEISSKRRSANKLKKSKSIEPNKQQGNNNKWQKAMVDHYLRALATMEESDLRDKILLAKRQQQVATFFKQTGEYDSALELIEKTLDMERMVLGERPENMADLYWLTANTYQEIFNTANRVSEVDPECIRKQMKNARQSLKIRRTIMGDDNKFALGRGMMLLGNALRRWVDYGGDSTLDSADAETEAMKLFKESVQIFTQLNSIGYVAKAFANMANLLERRPQEKKQLMRKALTMCNKTYGEYSVLSANIHYNMYVMHKRLQDFQESYVWLIKCMEIREKIYGRHHPQTQMLYDILEHPIYVEIKNKMES